MDWSLGQEDPLEEEMAIHSSTLAEKIPWQATVHGVAKSQTWLSTRTHAIGIWEMWELVHRKGWVPKNGQLQIVVLDIKEINPEYSLEGLLLKLQYFSHLMQRANSLEKPLMPGKIEGRRRRGWQRMRWWDKITDSMEILGDGRGQRSLACCRSWGRKSRTWFSDWKTTSFSRHLQKKKVYFPWFPE